MTVVEYGLFVVLHFTSLEDCEAVKDMMYADVNVQCFMSYRELVTEHPKPMMRPFTAEELDKVITK